MILQLSCEVAKAQQTITSNGVQWRWNGQYWEQITTAQQVPWVNNWQTVPAQGTNFPWYFNQNMYRTV